MDNEDVKPDEGAQAADSGDKPIAEDLALQAAQKATKTADSAEMAALQARIEEAEAVAKEATRAAKAATAKADKLASELAAVTKVPEPAKPREQRSLAECNAEYRKNDELRRKELSSVEADVNKALAVVFKAGKTIKHRVRKNVKAPAE